MRDGTLESTTRALASSADGVVRSGIDAVPRTGTRQGKRANGRQRNRASRQSSRASDARLFRAPYLVVVLIAILSYVVADLQASGNMGVAFANRSIVHALLVLVILLQAAYALFSSARLTVKPVLSVAVVALTAWMLVVNLGRTEMDWVVIVQIAMSVWFGVTIIFTAKYLAQNSSSTAILIRFAILVMMLYAVSTVIAARRIKPQFDASFAVVNLVYYVLACLPFVFLLRRPLPRVLLLIGVILVTVISAKRGAIIVLPLMIAANSWASARSSKIRSLTLVAVMAAYGLALFLANGIMGGWLEERFAPESLEYGSGREYLYSQAWEAFTQGGFLDLLIGQGGGRDLDLLGTSAHNDWLTMALSYGLVGVGLYATLVVILIKRVFLLRKLGRGDAGGMAAAAVFAIVVSMIGSVYFAHYTFMIMLFVGLSYSIDSQEIP